MNVFSDERVEGIAEKILQELIKAGLTAKTVKKMQFTPAVKRGYVKFYRFSENLEKNVKKRISLMSKPPQDGSPQYRALFEKQLADEWKKY